MNHKKRILITGTLLASAILSGLLIHSRADAVPAERVIHITAKKFDFSPDSITLKKGEPVVFEISSADREHDLTFEPSVFALTCPLGKLAGFDSRRTRQANLRFHATCTVAMATRR